MAATLAHFPLIFPRDVQTRRAAYSVLLEADPTGITVGNPILGISPKRCFLCLARGTCLGLVRRFDLWAGVLSIPSLLFGCLEEVTMVGVVGVRRVGR